MAISRERVSEWNQRRISSRWIIDIVRELPIEWTKRRFFGKKNKMLNVKRVIILTTADRQTSKFIDSAFWRRFIEIVTS